MNLLNTNVPNLETRGITIFYSKRTGEIISYSACSTPQTFEDYWGTRSEDMKIIYSSLFTDFELDIVQNIKSYHVADGVLKKKIDPIIDLQKEVSSLRQELNLLKKSIIQRSM